MAEEPGVGPDGPGGTHESAPAPEGMMGGDTDLLVSEKVAREDRGPIGPFPSWPWLYGTVLVYGTVVILVLWILTRVMNP